MLTLSRFWRNRNEEIAAIDLGSNSFHMIIARVAGGQISIVDRLKESVRLGYGLDDDGNLDDLSQKRALDCLERFHQRIKHLSPARVRAVGTRTLRQANNAAEFLHRAEAALGFDIQIVTGIEEARLVYQGVAFGLEDDHQRRLVIDIGGGSTEMIIGEDFSPITMESFGMGCVSVTKKYFPNGHIKNKFIKAAELSCQRRLEPFQGRYKREGWDRAIGCSGSIKAISAVLEAMTGNPLITQQGLASILDECRRVSHVDELNLPNLNSQRQPVFIGGLIVLKSVMNMLNIEALEASPWALREGVLFDLLGNDSISDIRDRSVRQLVAKFYSDPQHTEQTTNVAAKLFKHVARSRPLDDQWLRYLTWACMLQEIGITINHDKFHVHSAYIVENSHLAGFGHNEQRILVNLVRHQRKKPNWSMLDTLDEEDKEPFLITLLIFRLACVLTRARNDVQDIGWALTLDGDHLSFSAPSAWWLAQPLATADLEAELNYVKKSPLPLQLMQPIHSDQDPGNARLPGE